MNTIRCSILASLLPVALLAMAMAVSASVPVEYQVHFTAEDMTIDGRADEKSWSVAPLAKMVDRAYPNGETLSPSITTVQALWSEQGLWVLFQCKDENILARFTERDYQKLYLDNTVELFLDPDMNGTPYVQLIINALNTKSDALYLDPPWIDDGIPAFSNWDSGTESAVVVSGSIEDRTDRDESWTVEFLFPWRSMSQAALNPLVSDGYGDAEEEGHSDSDGYGDGGEEGFSVRDGYGDGEEEDHSVRVQADDLDLLGDRSIPPKVGDKWKANFMRFDHGDEEDSGVLSTWSPFPDGDGRFISTHCVHYSAYWGVLVFVE